MTIQHFNSTDGTSIRYTYLSPNTKSPSNQHLIFLQGRSTMIENYHAPISQLLDRGFHVWMMDWRGQGGSERTTSHPQKNHIINFDHYLSDLEILIQSQIFNTHTKPELHLLGISMGAHLGLRYLQLNPELFKSAIFVSPMFNVYVPKWQQFSLNCLVPLLSLIKLDSLYAPGYGNHEYLTGKDLYYDPEQYEQYKQVCENHRNLLTGGPTLAWAKAMLQSIAQSIRLLSKTSIQTPILITLAEEDTVVDNDKAIDFHNQLPNSTLKTYPKAHHNIFLDHSRIIEQFWKDVDYFFQNNAHH